VHRRALELENEELASLGLGVKQQAALAVLADEGTMSQRRLAARPGPWWAGPSSGSSAGSTSRTGRPSSTCSPRPP
jgi:hypothetical protein